MATRKLKFKHIAESATVHIGDAGELILDTTNKTLKVSDGSTSGGTGLALGRRLLRLHLQQILLETVHS